MAPIPSGSRRDVLRTLGSGVALSALGGTAAARGAGRGRGRGRDRSQGRGRGRGRGGGRAPGAGDGIVELLSVPGELVPENLGFDRAGNLYFGITAGQLRRIPAGRTDASGLALDDTTLVTDELPGAAGVEVGPGGTVYVAGGSSGLVFAVSPGGEVTALARLVERGSGFVNDVVVDADHHRLLVTESFGGAVYAVPLNGGAASVFVRDSLLDTESFGANGPALGPEGDLFVAVTRTEGGVGRVVEVPIRRADGRVGELSVLAEGEALFGADGLTARGSELYVAVNARNEVTRIGAGGELETVVEGDPLVFPSEAVFGRRPGQRCDLFVCNFANPRPEAAGILRVPSVR